MNWQKIDFVFKNGPDFHYEVDVFDADSGRWVSIFICLYSIGFNLVNDVKVLNQWGVIFVFEEKLTLFFPFRQINKTVGEVEVHDDYAKFINMENNMKFR